MKSSGTLIFFCGKMGAGKTTMSIQLAEDRNAVLISEDVWLSEIYPNQIANFTEYVRFAKQIKSLVKSHVQRILRTGTNVVMDFPANTVSQREWFKGLFSEVNAPHELIYLDASNELCLQHLAKRQKEQPDRAAFDKEEVFLQVTSYFEEPNTLEGFTVRRIETRT